MQLAGCVLLQIFKYFEVALIIFESSRLLETKEC